MQPIIRHFQINSGITGEGDVEHSESENVTKTIQRILGMSYYIKSISICKVVRMETWL